jgi:hypothetical protein
LNKLDARGRSIATPIVDPKGEPDAAVVSTVPAPEALRLTNAFAVADVNEE